MIQYNEQIYLVFTNGITREQAADRAFAFFDSLPLEEWNDTPWWRGAQPAKDPKERTNGGLMIAHWLSWNPAWWLKVVNWAEANGYTETKK